ncbi:MAG: hypothetical protein QOC66_3874 [Pseudonocardiales bacterium]|jgi:hypothetical protein|nr:hypothetical protein [Pseudonocardiales bacterium]
MRRHVRSLGIAGALTASMLLAGCDKPVPKVTVQRGAFSTTITPSTYCFDSVHCRTASGLDFPVIDAGLDERIMVDVPRDLLGKGWSVTALTLDGTKPLGSSGTIHDSHSYRVAANTNNGNPFVVQVAQLRKGKPDGSKWSFLVKVSDQT